MKVLRFLVNSRLNLVSQSLVNYLVDSGHVVFVYPSDIENNLKWKSKYKHNVYVLNNNFSLQDIDCAINFNNLATISSLSEIHFNIQLIDGEYFIISSLRNNNSDNITCVNSSKLNCLSNSLSNNLHYLVNEITEVFIDTVVYLLRFHEDGEITLNNTIFNNNSVVDVVQYISTLEKLNDQYKLLENDENVFLIKNIVTINDINLEFYERKLLLGNQKAKLSRIDLEILVLYLLTILNSRQNGLYGYDFRFSTLDGLVTHNKFSKFIDLNTLDSYVSLLSKCNSDLYNIANSNFYPDLILQNSRISPEISVAYDYEKVDKEYLLSLYYNSYLNELSIKYAKDLYFFNEFEKYIDSFFNNFKNFRSGNDSFKKLLNFSQGYRFSYTVDYNQTNANYSFNKTIKDLFEEQVERTPDNTAIIYNRTELSYRELNNRSNQLANYLGKIRNIKPEILVALFLDRSEHMLTAIISVLKIGGAYVPIDPSYPDERIKLILKDIGIVLTNEVHEQRLKEIISNIPQDLDEVSIVLIDSKELQERLLLHLTTNPKTTITSDNLAYVIYTSGTSGMPKGVMVQHKGVINLITMQGKEFELANTNSIKNCLWYTNYVFDAHVSEVYTSILNGHVLHVVDDDIRYDLILLNNYIKVNDITIATIPPALLNNKDLLELDILVVAGDKTNREILEQYRNINVKLINAYGPTEITVCATLNHYHDNGASNIGKAIHNCECYVLDNDLNPLPVGVIGELYLAGVGLARGYLNKPDLTAEKFIANPFYSLESIRSDKYTRIYKTGDLVRWLPNGDLEYIGRNDFQVKIRGHRIELTEIESTLALYNGITQSVVIAKDHQIQSKLLSKYLVGYYVAATQLDEESILKYLRANLPEYMVPSVLMYLQELPLTINGKLDRNALPDHEFTSNDAWIEPRNQFERKICQIWTEVLGLGISKIGIRNDFFMLGGNSVSAIKLVSRLNGKFKSDIKIKDIFSLKTVEKVSSLIKNTIGSFVYKDHLITESDIANLYEPFPLTNVQQAYYLGRSSSFELGNVSTHVYSEYKFSYLNVESLEGAFNQLIKRHFVLHTIFINNQQQYLKEVPYYKIGVYELSSELELITIRDKLSHKIYSPEVYPLFDILVTKLSNSYILHISFDALLIDMSSFSLLSRELTELYNNPNSLLSNLKVSYRDYILKYESIRASTLYAEAEKYWRNKIDEYNFDVNLPLLTSPSNVKNPRFARISKTINSKIWNKLLNKSQKLSISSTTLVLEIYGKVLSYWSGQDKICINITLFNRLPIHPQINEIIGDFTVLELFNYIDSSKKTTSQKLKNTHESLWKDIEHNLFDGIDFQRLVKTQKLMSANQIVSPIVLTSILGGINSNNYNNPFDLPIDKSYQGINYSITQTSQVWLDNKVYETNEGLVVEWEYVAQLFDREVIEEIHCTYCKLIEVLADIDWDTELMPTMIIPQKDKELIGCINNYKQELSVDTLFTKYEKLIEKNLLYANIAVIDSGTQNEYSYKQLVIDSNLLSKYILLKDNLGKKPNDIQGKLIGILTEKGYNQVVGTLSIMKSGYGYLPLSISWPIGRLNEVLKQAVPLILLISKAQYNQQQVRNLLSKKYQIIIIEDVLLEIHTNQKINSQLEKINLPQVEPDSIAYVIFTSGSTGKPKGVTISHRGALNTIDAVNARFNVTSKDKILALSELSFDLSVYDIFGILVVGGSIIFPKQEQAQDSKHWLDLISKYKITIWNTVPQLAGLLMEEIADSNLEKLYLRLFLLSGDWIPINLPDKIKKYCCNATVMSLGGATEGSIWSIWYEIEKVKKEWRSIPYGIAMPNQQLYVLNHSRECCPVQVTGEIYIGGIGVALNYWGDQDLTYKSFIDHDVFGRLYKTGDLGKWYQDGYLEFIGRKDSQIKLNGYRVELGEISAKLTRLKAVEEAVVTIQRQDDKDYIIGYLVPKVWSKKQSKGVAPAELFYSKTLNVQESKKSQSGNIDQASLIKKVVNKKLSKLLPKYMLPDFYIILEKLPISANGKLDTSKLPKFLLQEANFYAAPRNDLEKRIAKIWSEVLGIALDKVGINDNFFGLGGSSISAIRLISKLNEQCNSNISLDVIFKYDTVKKIAKYVSHRKIDNVFIDKLVVSKVYEQLLSFGQERLWFIDKYEEGTNAYNLTLAFKLRSNTNIDLLENSIRSIVSRHEVFRTLIKEDINGNAYQVIANDKEHLIQFLRIGLADKSQLNEKLKNQTNQLYDLSNDYPIRLSLYEFINTDNTTELYLGIVIHHIAFDGWSINIFLNELQAHYRYFFEKSKGLEAVLDLPEVTIQYKDFALWQRSYLSGKRLDKQIIYWRNKLSDYEPLNLISDKPRPSHISYEGSDKYFELDEDTSIGLRKLAKQLNVSLYSLLLAGYCLMLRVYSNQDDIVIGTPVANRHYNQVENLIGFFVNTIALRIKIDSKISIKEFIQAVGKEVIEAQLYQDLPFERLVEELKVEKDTSRHPIFQVMFDVHNFGNDLCTEKKQSEEIYFTEILESYSTNSFSDTAQFDISTSIDDSHDTLRGNFNYAVSIYEETTIAILIETYTAILKQFATLAGDINKKDSTKIHRLKYLNHDQYQKIIYNWNATKAEYAMDKTIHGLFEEQVEKYPRNLAVVYEDVQITYGELNIRSNQLTHYISSSYEIKTGALVCICLERSELIPIAIIAILKAGGAYVPIDPNYPDDRIRYILEDTGTKLLLTNATHQERLERINGTNLEHKTDLEGKAKNQRLKILAIDSGLVQAQLLLNLSSNINKAVNSTDLAYVIYTSGTTGRPKGVMIQHQGIVNLQYDLTKRYKLGDSRESILLFANYVFDTSVEQITLSLLNGHTLVIIPNELWLNKDKFYNYLNVNKITHIEASPTFLQQYDFHKVPSLKRLIFGGEQLNSQICLKLRLDSNQKIVNSYGPTEVSITSVVNIIENNTNVSIGVPLSNITSYVLDDNLTVLPIGAIGELYIGGVGLARGYLNRPDLTAEKFIANPFNERNLYEDLRLYKTGDLVRWLPKGTIEYIGRNDFQVKIRGYRVELGEVESVLSSFDRIKQSIVVIKEHKVLDSDASKNSRFTNSKYLVGYYLSDYKLDEKEIISYLQGKLLDYMIPSVFVHLESLPLTRNGKLDRKALPSPEFVDVDSYIAPRNEIETEVCKIWAEILGVSKDRIGITDNFFRLGGDSIISIQLVSRLWQRLGLKISVKDIFEFKTISKLYDNVFSKELDNFAKAYTKNEQGILNGELDLLPIQKWFFESNFEQPNHWNQSFVIKTLKLDINKLQASIAELIEHHDNFRLRYKKSQQNTKKRDGVNGSNYIQYYDSNSKFQDLKILDIRSLNLKEQSSEFNSILQSILTKWQSNFNLEYGPLYSVGYIYGYKDGTARIFFALHHLIADTISWRILVEDLQILYNGGKLDAKGSSYRQWVNAVNQWANNIGYEKKYWNGVLIDHDCNILNKLIISIDDRSYSKVQLSREKTTQLLKESSKAYNTEINDILLAALAGILYEITGNKINHIMLEGHGRQEIDETINISRTVGWFTTMYPVRLELIDDIANNIKTIKETLRKIPNKGIGYGVLIGYKQDIIPKISFNYLGQFDKGNSSINSHNLNNLWDIVSEGSGESVSQLNQDLNIIDINCAVIDHKLQFNIESKLNKSTTQRLATLFIQKLEEIIVHTTKQDRSYLTASDIDNLISVECLDNLQEFKEIEGVYLCNSLQQGFVYHNLTQGIIDTAYRGQLIWQYNASIEIDTLKQAWFFAQRKFSSLRLRFSWNEELVQIIDKKGILNFKYLDLSKGQDTIEQELKIKQIQTDDKLITYDLEQGSLFRVCIIKQKADLYTCIFSNHHIILDGWSNALLLDYVHEVYLKLLDKEILLVSVDNSYEIAQKFLQKHQEEHREYWSKYISQIKDKTDLSGLLSKNSKYEKVKICEYRHIKDEQELLFIVKDSFYYKLKQVCQEESLTLNAILQFTWHKALSIFSNSKQTVVGTTVSGRNLPINNIETSVGLYINTLPLIVIHQNKNIVQAIKEIQDNINEINTRSTISLATLQSNGERLFDNLFVYENYPISANKKEQYKLNVISMSWVDTLDYSLVATAYELNNQLTFKIRYANEIFDKGIIQILLSVIRMLIEQISNNPRRKISELSYLDENQNNQIIRVWNTTEKDYPRNKTINRLFEEQVEQRPDSIAVVYENELLTYRELNDGANRLANYLISTRSIKPDTLVGLCIDRSEHMLIAILGILKAGGAYVPIDPNYPDDRIEYILRDTKTEIILTNEVHKERIQGISNSGKNFGITTVEAVKQQDITILAIDNESLQKDLFLQSTTNPQNATNRDNLAYVIYTSGTTGNPKGVMIENKGIVNRINWMNDTYPLNGQDKILQKTPYVFDVSIWELLWPCSYGACVVFSKPEGHKNPSYIIDLMNKERVTITHFVPSMLSVFEDELNRRKSKDIKQENLIQSLRYIFCSGEELNLREVQQCYKLLPHCGIHNLYGPTETSIDVLHYTCSDEKQVYIGTPIANTSVYVLSDNLMPLPIGATGELYIGGVGLARGYLNRADLTAERFIANPFQNEDERRINTNSRLYKTGDLVRWLFDGNLEYIGRNDSQVKIRGYRIELGEVENVLSEYDCVRQSVVIAKKHIDIDKTIANNKYLVAYYVSETKLDKEEILNYLQTKLPEYMIPSVFVHLDQLPLTTNGKLDRKALPDPEFTDGKSYVAPRNELEEQICQIWSEILNLPKDKVGINDDFFKLGGNSILAIKLVSKLNKEVYYNISISNIFEYKTVEKLACYLGHNRTNSRVEYEF